jgi:signal transduction histidine kinase
MPIRKMLYLNSLLIVMVGILSALMIVSFSRKIEQEEREVDAAEEIIRNVFELNAILNEYLASREEPSFQRWEKRHETLGPLLSSSTFDDSEEIRLLGSSRETHAALGGAFHALRALLDAADRRGGAFLEETAARQRTRVMMLSGEMATDADALRAMKSGRSELHRLQVEAFFVLLSLLLIAGGATVTMSFIVARSILRPIENLRRGTQSVAEGNLDHRLDGEGSDELGQLTAAFNRMTDRLQASLTDIESLEQAEARIRRLNRQLKRKVADLREMNREVESFSYSVSHDLRAPLRGIHGFARILMEEHSGELSGKGSQFLSIIVDNTRKMGELIDGLLGLSRLGRKRLRKANVDMKLIAQEVFEEIAANAPERKIELSLHDIPPAQGDAALLRQVWINYIGNAVKFTSERETAAIEIGALPEAGKVTYFVRDNGVGFESRHAEKVFGLFQRLHGSGYEGTGIGLALVQRIVRRHGGEVVAEGTAGQGATFSFSIPAPARRRKPQARKSQAKKREIRS